YVLPGLPEAFRRTLDVVQAELGSAGAFVSRSVYVDGDEGEIADLLETLERSHPEIRIGSYPRLDEPRERVRVTVDGRERGSVDACVAALCAALPPGFLVRTD